MNLNDILKENNEIEYAKNFIKEVKNIPSFSVNTKYFNY